MVTFRAYARVDFGNLDIFGGFDESASFTRDPATQDTQFTVTPDPAQLPNVSAVVTGTDFGYLGPYPTSGTIRTVTFYNTAGSGPDQKVFKLSGLELTPFEVAAYADDNPYVVANELFKGADRITGSGFDDFLAGFAGRDTLTGGAGKDTFYFNTALGQSNVDTITGFVRADDTIGLDHAVFKRLGTDGVLKAGLFKDITDGLRVQDGNDRILYNHDTGKLFYDADGKGGAGPKLFAVLQNDPVIDHKDFELF